MKRKFEGDEDKLEEDLSLITTIHETQAIAIKIAMNWIKSLRKWNNDKEETENEKVLREQQQSKFALMLCNPQLSAAINAIISTLLDFALSIQAGGILREEETSQETTLSPSANMLLIQSIPLINSDHIPQSKQTNYEFLLGSSSRMVNGISFIEPTEMKKKEELKGALIRHNRACFNDLLVAIIGNSQKSQKVLQDQLIMRTTFASPLPSLEMYGEILPKQPMFERDIQTRRLFSQNPILLDAFIASINKISATENKTDSVNDLILAPNSMFQTCVSLFASSASSWYSSSSSTVNYLPSNEIINQTSQLIKFFRLCDCLPFPVNYFDELLCCFPSKSIWPVLAAILRHLLIECPNGQLRHSLSNSDSSQRCLFVLRREIQSNLTSLSSLNCERFLFPPS